MYTRSPATVTTEVAWRYILGASQMIGSGVGESPVGLPSVAIAERNMP